MWGDAIPGLFPAGSGGGDSRAQPGNLDQPGRFRSQGDGPSPSPPTASCSVARAGDSAGFAARRRTAVEAACTACHVAYRAD